MIQDYFSLDVREPDLYLLRIINNVDFAPEIVWSQSFIGESEKNREQVALKILDYLSNGFDSIDTWPTDELSWHNSIKHYGFSNLLKTQSLVPCYLIWKHGKEVPSFVNTILDTLQANQAALAPVRIGTEAGLLYQCLSELGIKSFKPKDFHADVFIPLSMVFALDLEEIGNLLENYS